MCTWSRPISYLGDGMGVAFRGLQDPCFNPQREGGSEWPFDTTCLVMALQTTACTSVFRYRRGSSLCLGLNPLMSALECIRHFVTCILLLSSSLRENLSNKKKITCKLCYSQYEIDREHFI